MYELLGIEKTNTYLYHKTHIEKVMAVAFVAYAFNLNEENGSNGVKIGLSCVQGASVAKRDVRQSHKTHDGKHVMMVPLCITSIPEQL